jgi:hypothetical protein
MVLDLLLFGYIICVCGVIGEDVFTRHNGKVFLSYMNI